MKHLTNLAGMVVITLVMYIAAISAEIAILKQFVTGVPESMTLSEWIRIWERWAVYSVASAVATFLIWYLLGQFLAPDFTGRSSKRPIWILLLVPPAIVAVAGSLELPSVAAGGWLAQLFLFLDALFTFWAISAFFSPSLVKTDPVWSKGPRKLRESLGI